MRSGTTRITFRQRNRTKAAQDKKKPRAVDAWGSISCCLSLRLFRTLTACGVGGSGQAVRIGASTRDNVQVDAGFIVGERETRASRVAFASAFPHPSLVGAQFV